MPDGGARRPSGQSKSTEVSRALVKALHEVAGRGPTSARTTINGDLVVTVFTDTLSKADRTLVGLGRGEEVLRRRMLLQDAMGPLAIPAVEAVLGRRVTAFMSANNVDPDLAVEIFILAPDADDSGGVPPDSQPPGAS